MEIITSAQNERIRETGKLKQRKYREARGLFLAEGLRLAEEAEKAAAVAEVYYHETLADTPRGEEVLKKLSAKAERMFQVTARVLQSLAETETPQGIVLVCRIPSQALEGFRPGGGLVAVSDGMQDPGNLGTVLRTLWAAGGRGMLCLEGSADPFNGKSVRASMGALFHVPVFKHLSWPDAAVWAEREGYRAVAADAAGGRDYRRFAWPGRTLLCIGNEARGLLSVPRREVAERVFIPLAEGAESLNAAVAAGILFFAARGEDG